MFIKSFRGRGHQDPEVIDRLLVALSPEAVDQFRKSFVSIVGVGALGYQIARMAVWKGYNLKLVDGGRVKLANLPQGFKESDVGLNKAIAAAKVLAEETPFPVKIWAIPATFEEAIREGTNLSCNVAVAVTDNYQSRLAVASHFYKDVPVVAAGISRDLSFGWVFVQEPGEGGRDKVSLAHALGEPTGQEGRENCGMVNDIAYLVAGLVSYAIDSLIISERRPRRWNWRIISFGGEIDRAENLRKYEAEGEV